jgi:drug/metabolite transporter (DMT)-like permease
MSLLALSLLLISAVLHATWNFLAKRTHGGSAFVWLYDLLSTLLYAPIMLLLVFFYHLTITSTLCLFVVGSAVLHLGYFILLQRGYRVGDMSLVYPLARGTGPLLTTLIALTFLGEHLPPPALVGIVLIVLGIFIVSGGTRLFSSSNSNGAILYGLLTGLSIALYTLWDQQSVGTFHIFPVLYFYLNTATRMVLLAPYGLSRWHEVRAGWHEHRFEVLGVAVLAPLTYFIVLTVLVFTPVSYVAATREVGVLFGAWMGTRLLAEGNERRVWLASVLIVVGIAALAIA